MQVRIVGIKSGADLDKMADAAKSAHGDIGAIKSNGSDFRAVTGLRIGGVVIKNDDVVNLRDDTAQRFIDMGLAVAEKGADVKKAKK